MARRVSVASASSNLSICGEDGLRSGTDAKNAHVTDDVIVESTESRAASSLAGFLSMSRVKQLTVISFSLSNLGVGCFFSILGPFFPTEVGSTYRVHQNYTPPKQRQIIIIIYYATEAAQTQYNHTQWIKQ